MAVGQATGVTGVTWWGKPTPGHRLTSDRQFGKDDTLDEILVNAQAQLEVTFTVDGTPTDPTPATCTLGITRADGTVLVAAGQSATHGGAGQFTYSLAVNQNTRLDILTATWTSALGVVKTYYEVVGGFMVTASDLLALYPDETAESRGSRRATIQDRLEGACGVSFRPRYCREVKTAVAGRVRLKWREIRAIRSLTMESVVMTSDQIALLDVDSDRGVIAGLSWARRHSDVVVEYEHGLDFVTETGRNAALILTRETFGPDVVDGRVVMRMADRQQIQYATPVRRKSPGSAFLNPEVAAFVDDNAGTLFA